MKEYAVYVTDKEGKTVYTAIFLYESAAYDFIHQIQSLKDFLVEIYCA
jgi:hypothetical protein